MSKCESVQAWHKQFIHDVYVYRLPQQFAEQPKWFCVQYTHWNVSIYIFILVYFIVCAVHCACMSLKIKRTALLGAINSPSNFDSHLVRSDLELWHMFIFQSDEFRWDSALQSNWIQKKRQINWHLFYQNWAQYSFFGVAQAFGICISSEMFNDWLWLLHHFCHLTRCWITINITIRHNTLYGNINNNFCMNHPKKNSIGLMANGLVWTKLFFFMNNSWMKWILENFA